jgi:hypothetical protein
MESPEPGPQHPSPRNHCTNNAIIHQHPPQRCHLRRPPAEHDTMAIYSTSPSLPPVSHCSAPLRSGIGATPSTDFFRRPQRPPRPGRRRAAAAHDGGAHAPCALRPHCAARRVDRRRAYQRRVLRLPAGSRVNAAGTDRAAGPFKLVANGRARNSGNAHTASACPRMSEAPPLWKCALSAHWPARVGGQAPRGSGEGPSRPPSAGPRAARRRARGTHSQSLSLSLSPPFSLGRARIAKPTRMDDLGAATGRDG